MEAGIKEALALLEQGHEGALATLEDPGPFVSAVSFIYAPPVSGERFGRVHLFLSGLARHTQNFQKNPNVSLLVTESGPAPAYEKKRVTLQGIILPVKDAEKFEELKLRYIRQFPASEMFFGFSDFRFFEIEISDLHWIAGFGKIETFR